ncbi:MAG: D-glycero-beta-D-manno-heptose 1-phosphate adenylyltransferase [Syntrophales bacterium]|nr:D-glycero-beta-D-manno-heptose 1-phosphate adenylyltransferase [Syntrophales bacterium]MDY0044028.1 D-glycero-beta-D-manno-heptose 1-phosphate adenylyltransferase [Syntrophales bacterium]
MNKLLSHKELKLKLDVLKAQGKKIVFTNGCFDILHVGHVTYLQKAKDLGDVLVIGINSDSSVASIKGPSRPIIPQTERATVISALESADFVILFDEDTPQKLIEYIRPHILVKGGDWAAENIAGKNFAEEVVIIPFVEGASTSKIIERIKAKL